MFFVININKEKKILKNTVFVLAVKWCLQLCHYFLQHMWWNGKNISLKKSWNIHQILMEELFAIHHMKLFEIILLGDKLTVSKFLYIFLLLYIINKKTILLFYICVSFYFCFNCCRPHKQSVQYLLLDACQIWKNHKGSSKSLKGHNFSYNCLKNTNLHTLLH